LPPHPQNESGACPEAAAVPALFAREEPPAFEELEKYFPPDVQVDDPNGFSICLPPLEVDTSEEALAAQRRTLDGLPEDQRQDLTGSVLLVVLEKSLGLSDVVVILYDGPTGDFVTFAPSGKELARRLTAAPSSKRLTSQMSEPGFHAKVVGLAASLITKRTSEMERFIDALDGSAE